jgi:hypothetical protein
MIEGARAAQVPFAWFTADEEFGQNPGLCAYLEAERIPYVMGITEEHHVPRRHRPHPRDRTLRTAVGAQRRATSRLRHRSKGAPSLRLDTGQRGRTGPAIPHPTLPRRRRTRVLPMPQPEPGRIRRTRAGGRRPPADRRMLRSEQERNRARQLPDPHLERMAPPHRILHARPHLPRHHRASRQKKRRPHTPSEPNQRTRKPCRYTAA